MKELIWIGSQPENLLPEIFFEALQVLAIISISRKKATGKAFYHSAEGCDGD